MNELCLCHDSSLQLLHIILIVLIEWLCTSVLSTGNFGKIVTLYHLGLKPGYIFLPRQFQGLTVVGQLLQCSDASVYFIVASLSGTCCVSPPHFHF